MSLCPESSKRAAMTDAEFWDYVLNGTEDPRHDQDAFYPYNGEGAEVHNVTPCPECGEWGECGYDADGRPYVHVVDESAADRMNAEQETP